MASDKGLVGRRIKVTAHACDVEGNGIATLPDGKTAFIEGLLDDEICEAIITSEKAHYCNGKVLSILEKSSYRVDPPCRFYDECGGCSLMHMKYEETLRIKQKRVLDCLTRIAHIDKKTCEEVLQPIVGSNEINNYRNHMQYIIKDGITGFSARGSNGFVAVDKCRLEYKEFTEIRCAIEECFSNNPTRLFQGLVLRGSQRTREILVEFVTELQDSHELILRDVKRYMENTSLLEKLEDALGASAKISGIVLRIAADKTSKRTRNGKRFIISGNDGFTEVLLEHEFSIKSGAFFQVNTAQAEALYSIAREACVGSKSVYDLYCGTGSIGLCCTNNEQLLTGVEVSPEAIASAKINAALSDATTRSRFICKQVEKLNFADEKLPVPDVVICDPPRKGMDPAFVAKLFELSAEKIVYISCDPATLGRDLSQLLKNYSLEKVVPVDMFPWTSHVETVVLMSRAKE